MPRCSGFKPDGSPCERIVGASQEHCYSHDPSRSQERHKAASKAAKSKPNREIQDAKQRLSQLADDVLAGKVNRGTGAVVGQILNVYLRALSVELKLRETEELEREVAEIREALKIRKEQRRWG